MIAIALVNGLYVYPEMKKIYQRRYSVKMHEGDPTHYVSRQITDALAISIKPLTHKLFSFRHSSILKWTAKTLAVSISSSLAKRLPSL